MKKSNELVLVAALIIAASTHVSGAEDKLDLETSVIRGNKELPQILYVVPWQDEVKSKDEGKHRLELHSLFGDLFDPMTPQKIEKMQSQETNQ